MKKNFTIKLLLALIVGFLPSVLKADTTIDGVTYMLISGYDYVTETRNVTMAYAYSSSTNDIPEDLVIPSKVTINGTEYAVRHIENSIFANCTKLKSITIPSTVNYIGQYAFLGCTNLVSVTFEEATGTEGGLIELGPSVFKNCTSLTSIVFPSTLKKMAGASFNGCTALESITLTSTTPPSIYKGGTNSDGSNKGDGTFPTDLLEHCNVIVPEESLEAYQSDSKFKTILENAGKNLVPLCTGVTTGTTGWATGCLTYDAVVPAGTKAYYVSAASGNTVTLTELTTIPANEGFIFNATTGTYTFEEATTTPAAISNKLVGVLATTSVTANSVYVLGKMNSGKVGMLTYTGTEINYNKAYLPMAETNSSKSLTFDFGEATGISAITNSTSEGDNAIYNLQGQRVSDVRSGEIYIKNGKKIIK